MTNAKLAPRNTTGLGRGDASALAKRFGYSVQHVCEVAKGNRAGSPLLLRAILRCQAREAKRLAQ